MDRKGREALAAATARFGKDITLIAGNYRSELERALGAEEDKLGRLPESLEGSDTWSSIEDAMASIEEALDGLDDVENGVGAVMEAVGQLAV